MHPLLSILERRYGGESAAEANGRGDRGRSASDFLYTLGSPHAALRYAALFVPQFVEIEGAVSSRTWAGRIRLNAKNSQNACVAPEDSLPRPSGAAFTATIA
jgi:hypothetical protein